MTKRERFSIPIAVFMILRHENSVLLLKRGQTGWKDGYYSLPAGSLDAGEDILSAAVREAKEEVGVTISKEQVRLFHAQHCKVDEQNWLNIYFETEIWEGDPSLCEPHKHSEVTWCKIDDLPKMMVEYVRETLSIVSEPAATFGW